MRVHVKLSFPDPIKGIDIIEAVKKAAKPYHAIRHGERFIEISLDTSERRATEKVWFEIGQGGNMPWRHARVLGVTLEGQTTHRLDPDSLYQAIIVEGYTWRTYEQLLGDDTSENGLGFIITNGGVD